MTTTVDISFLFERMCNGFSFQWNEYLLFKESRSHFLLHVVSLEIEIKIHLRISFGNFDFAGFKAIDNQILQD